MKTRNLKIEPATDGDVDKYLAMTPEERHKEADALREEMEKAEKAEAEEIIDSLMRVFDSYAARVKPPAEDFVPATPEQVEAAAKSIAEDLMSIHDSYILQGHAPTTPEVFGYTLYPFNPLTHIHDLRRPEGADYQICANCNLVIPDKEEDAKPQKKRRKQKRIGLSGS